MVKVRVVVVEDNLLGKGEDVVLEIEVKRMGDLALGINFAQALVKKAESLQIK